MAKSTRKKKMNIEEEKALLLNELDNNEALTKRNKENPDMQIQIGLIKRGFPQGQMWNKTLERQKEELVELKIQVSTEFEVINPVFVFQKLPEWQILQVEKAQKRIVELKENIEEITRHVEEVRNEVVAQEERMKERRTQILERLKELGYDFSKINEDVPSYIG